MFRGLSPSSKKILTLASKVSDQVGFKHTGKEALILDSKTPMKNILTEDLNELTARNFLRSNFRVTKLAE